MSDQDEKISMEDAENALRRSGSLLENRIETFIREQGYVVDANRAYPDPKDSTSREIDIHSFKPFTPLKRGQDDRIWAVLLIECLNNPQPMAFITKEP